MTAPGIRERVAIALTAASVVVACVFGVMAVRSYTQPASGQVKRSFLVPEPGGRDRRAVEHDDERVRPDLERDRRPQLHRGQVTVQLPVRVAHLRRRKVDVERDQAAEVEKATLEQDAGPVQDLDQIAEQREIGETALGVAGDPDADLQPHWSELTTRTPRPV